MRRRQAPLRRHDDSPMVLPVEKGAKEADLCCASAFSICARVRPISSAFASKVRWNYNKSKQDELLLFVIQNTRILRSPHFCRPSINHDQTLFELKQNAMQDAGPLDRTVLPDYVEEEKF